MQLHLDLWFLGLYVWALVPYCYAIGGLTLAAGYYSFRFVRSFLP